MYNTNPYATYKNQDLETISNSELVGRLFGAAAISLKMAVMDIGEKKLDKANNDIIKAQTIVVNLKGSLDMKIELSASLNSLYEYMLRRLIEANVKKDITILNEISGILIELRDAWNEAQKAYRMSQSHDTNSITHMNKTAMF
jgi:flagellar protein FliS